MYRALFLLGIYIAFVNLCFGQEPKVVKDSLGDTSYLEDQFYAGVAYNFLLNLPENATLRNFSYAIQLGFIKDIPLNEERNFGLGLGFGYGVNSYYSNIQASNTNGVIAYDIVDNADFDRSKLETHAIEFPFEIRWRNSNPVDYKFWRVYGGFKAAYLFSRRSKFVSNEGKSSFQNTDIEPWQYGFTLNFGYNTWNIQLYYALDPILEGATLDNAPIDIKPFTVGLIFYIL